MERLNIHAKLNQIQAQIKELVRSEENKFQKYWFFNECQVLQLLKPLLDKYQLTLLLSDDTNYPFIHEREGKEHFVKYLKRLEIVDAEQPESKLVFNFWAGGQNTDLAKAKGSAETYAIKYFLTKFFLIAVKDEGDPDYGKDEKDGMTNEEKKICERISEKAWLKQRKKIIKALLLEMSYKIFKESFWREDRKYVVAVSGGSDSVFLLDNMRRSGYNFIVAHVNYKKRQDSDSDEQIVRDYCQKYSLNCEIKSVEKDEYFPRVNFQAEARRIRYDFFQKLAVKHQTKFIIVAHHHDDHLETYLLQKQRKSLVDYWGLPTKIKLGKFWIIRPLLSLDKNDICQYLLEKKIAYANDITNQQTIYQRNIIRQKLSDLSEEDKKILTKEIDKKNQELKKIKKEVRDVTKKLFVSRYIFQFCKNNEYSSEVYLRFLYRWVNQATNGLLQQKKAQLLKEIYKQLFISKKKKIVIELGNNFHIIKSNNQVLISPY